MTRRPLQWCARAALSGAVWIAASDAPTAQQPPAFRVERPIAVNGAGPRRLAIDVPLLAGAAPFRVVSRFNDYETGQTVAVMSGLNDLRIFDASGKEVGYLLVRNPPAPPRFTVGTILPIAAVDTDKSRTSGF